MARQLVASAALFLASAALAHPGHGSIAAGSWLHGLEPEHAGPALAALALGVALWRRTRAARERRRR